MLRPRKRAAQLPESPDNSGLGSGLPLSAQRNSQRPKGWMVRAVSLWVCNEMPKLSTVQVAKLLGVHQPNFQRAIKQGTIPAPPLANVGGIKVRLWSSKDVRRAIEALKKSKGWKKPRRR